MKKLVVILIIIAVAAFFLTPERKKDSEFFESYVESVARTAAEGDLDSFTDYFSRQYRDERGIGYLQLREIVKNYFERYDKFETAYRDVTLHDYSEDPDGNMVATVTVDIFVTAFSDGVTVELVGVSGHFDNVTVKLKKTFFSGWKIIAVNDLGSKGYY